MGIQFIHTLAKSLTLSNAKKVKPAVNRDESLSQKHQKQLLIPSNQVITGDSVSTIDCGRCH